jgi:hypothetical protein
MAMLCQQQGQQQDHSIRSLKNHFVEFVEHVRNVSIIKCEHAIPNEQKYLCDCQERLVPKLLDCHNNRGNTRKHLCNRCLVV